jgi:hypothetical protein
MGKMVPVPDFPTSHNDKSTHFPSSLNKKPIALIGFDLYIFTLYMGFIAVNCQFDNITLKGVSYAFLK